LRAGRLREVFDRVNALPEILAFEPRRAWGVSEQGRSPMIRDVNYYLTCPISPKGRALIDPAALS